LADEWEDASRLAWIGFTQEQESFYIAYSFGALKKPSPHFKQGKAAGRFDYLEQTRVDADSYPKRDVSRLKNALRDLLTDDIEAAPGEDADEDDIDGMKADLVRFATLTALGVHALSLMEQPERIPLDVKGDFSVSISDDRETPASACKLPFVDTTWPKTRAGMVDALCSSKHARTLFLALLKVADSGKRVDLLETVREALTKQKLRAVDL
jgi:hypothetical protein